MKLPIIETPDYILAVSDEGIKRNDVLIYPLTDAIFKWDGNMPTRNEDRKIIAHLPKDDAKELNLPLLPEMVVEDNVDKLAEDYKNIKGSIPTTELEDEIFKLGFKDGYKAATKVYSEEDLRKAVKFFESYIANTGRNIYDKDISLYLDSLKQPKWFVAEMEKGHRTNSDGEPIGFPVHDIGFKTTTNSEGKQVLVGTYEYEKP